MPDPPEHLDSAAAAKFIDMATLLARHGVMTELDAGALARAAGEVEAADSQALDIVSAEAVEAAWGPCEGLVITRYGYARPTQGIEIVEAAHSYGGVVFHDVINVKHARKAAEQGVDGLILVCAGAAAAARPPP